MYLQILAIQLGCKTIPVSFLHASTLYTLTYRWENIPHLEDPPMPPTAATPSATHPTICTPSPRATSGSPREAMVLSGPLRSQAIPGEGSPPGPVSASAFRPGRSNLAGPSSNAASTPSPLSGFRSSPDQPLHPFSAPPAGSTSPPHPGPFPAPRPGASTAPDRGPSTAQLAGASSSLIQPSAPSSGHTETDMSSGSLVEQLTAIGTDIFNAMKEDLEEQVPMMVARSLAVTLSGYFERSTAPLTASLARIEDEVATLRSQNQELRADLAGMSLRLSQLDTRTAELQDRMRTPDWLSNPALQGEGSEASSGSPRPILPPRGPSASSASRAGSPMTHNGPRRLSVSTGGHAEGQEEPLDPATNLAPGSEAQMDLD